MATARSVYSQCSSTTGSGCKQCPVRGRPLDPYPGSMGSTPLSICGAPSGETCKVVKITVDNPAKCAIQSKSAAPLIRAAQNAALRCVNARRPHCNTAALKKCQSSYSYTTRQLLHSRGQTYHQKSMQATSYSSCYADECENLRMKDRVCCKALTATCLACEQGISVELYCKQNPGAPGCPADQELCDACRVQTTNVRRENNAPFAENEAVDTGLYISAVALGETVEAELDSHGGSLRFPSELEVLGLSRVRPSIL